LNFLGIWIAVLLFLAVTPKNRPILKALTTKTKGNTLKMFAVGLGIGLGMNLLCAFIAMLNGDIYITFDSVRPISLLFVFVTVLIQSAAEELVCRVFIYQRLMRRYNRPIFVAVVNAGFFALIHIFNDGIGILPLVNLFIHGLMFSAMVIYLDSPWAAMAGHAGWNFCQNILLGLPNSGNLVPYSVFKLDAAAATDSFAYSVAFGLEGAIVCTVVTLIAVGLIAWWGIKRKIVPTNIWESV
jgi:membrane protease YdiL (CAAX protease family)